MIVGAANARLAVTIGGMPPLTDLNDAEKALWEGFPVGALLDLRSAAEHPVVRAEVIAAVLLGGHEETPGHAAAVRLRGARITGQLKLAFADVRCPVQLEDCELDEPPDLYWTRMVPTCFCRSRMPGLMASNLRVDGFLNLDHTTVTDTVRLLGAQITGGLLLPGANLSTPAGAAVIADRIEVGGDMVLTSATVSGAVRMTNARIGGRLDLDEIRLTAAGADPALDAFHLTAEAGLYCRGAEIHGEVNLRQARITTAVVANRARLSNPAGVALRLDRATVDGGVFLHEGFAADGEVTVRQARIGRILKVAGAHLHNPGGVAFRADAVTVEGTLDFREGTSVKGETDLLDGTITGPAYFEGAHLHNPGGAALSANGITVGSLLDLCEGFTAEGRIRLANAKIGSRLCLNDATLRAPGVSALSCWRMETPEASLRWQQPPEGGVDLRHATIGILRDTPDQWPNPLELDGLRYDVLDPAVDASTRLSWLDRGSDGFRPQPYEQLASVYHGLGDGAQARTVLLAKQRHQTATLAWYARPWGLLQDVTVGYGYRPLRAALWLVALLAVSAVSFARDTPAPVDPQRGPDFQPVIFALDLLLPIIDLGQERAFQPNGGQQWLAYVLIVAGWLLATTIAAGLTRSLRRGA